MFINRIHSHNIHSFISFTWDAVIIKNDTQGITFKLKMHRSVDRHYVWADRCIMMRVRWLISHLYCTKQRRIFRGFVIFVLFFCIVTLFHAPFCSTMIGIGSQRNVAWYEVADILFNSDTFYLSLNFHPLNYRFLFVWIGCFMWVINWVWLNNNQWATSFILVRLFRSNK